MKIWIITSGSENLTLFKFLSKYDHEYLIYYDDLLGPYWDKPASLVQAVIADGIALLEKKWVDAIILSPVRELAFRSHSKVLPLFQRYLLEYCFAFSLVGKMGAIGDRSDIQVAQPLLESLAWTYVLSATQKKIKKFQTPFKRRLKETSLWKCFLPALSYSDPLVNRIIKFDLRYFKDAAIDTLIPLNYGYFNYQNTITKFLNFKKIRFHTLEKLENTFQVVTSDSWPRHTEGRWVTSTNYSVKIFYTGQKDLLERQKKVMWMLERGKEVKVEWEKV